MPGGGSPTPASQGRFEFTDDNDNIIIDGVLSATVTVTNGITPDVITISVPPFESYTRYGKIKFRYGNSSDNWPVVREWPNVVLDKIDIDRSDGTVKYQAQFMDRRWMWLDENGPGYISGEYNIARAREPIPDYEKTPQELATLCFEALGETNFDVSALPTQDRPHVNWKVKNPAKALAEICDLYSCEVSYKIDNTFEIVQIGTGVALPTGEMWKRSFFDPKEMPSALRCVSAPVEWQVDLVLEPVAPDIDEVYYLDAYTTTCTGDFKPIEELSYRPSEIAGSGFSSWLECADAEDFYWLKENGLEEEYELATEHIMRSFRITIDDDLSLDDPPDVEGEELPPEERVTLFDLTDIKQITPLIPALVETEACNYGKQRKPAIVWGRFEEGYGDEEEEPTYYDPYYSFSDLVPLNPTREDYDKRWEYKRGFSIDAERGIVTFRERVFNYLPVPSQRNPDGTDGSGVPYYPKLFLRCTVNLRDPATREAQRYYSEVTIDPDSPSGTAFDVRDDVLLQYHKERNAVDYSSNVVEAQETLDFYLTQVQKRYQSYPKETADYAGFEPVDTDGAIKQVTYIISQDGTAKTTIERNHENRYRVLTHEENRKREKLSEALKEREIERRKSVADRRAWRKE